MLINLKVSPKKLVSYGIWGSDVVDFAIKNGIPYLKRMPRTNLDLRIVMLLHVATTDKRHSSIKQ